MLKKRLGYAVRMIVFVLIAAFLWRAFEYVLNKPKDTSWYSDGFTNVYEEKDYYDLLVSGTSVTIAGINAQELYLEYGIAATSIGQPHQTTCMSYYSIEEALKYQTPKAIIFDVKSLFYSQEATRDLIRNADNAAVHLVLDDMKNGKTKYEAFRAIKEEFSPESNFWEFFSKMYYSHVYWEELLEEDFTHEQPKDRMDGNRLLLNITSKERSISVGEVENDGEAAIIPACNKKYLLMMIELCRQKNIDLILTRGNAIYDWNWKEYNAVRKIAEEYGLIYLDINLVEDEVGIDWTVDAADRVHLNMSGARKWTDYVGSYLKEHYDIPDRRLDSHYSAYEENTDRYMKRLEALNVKKGFHTAEDLTEYLARLKEFDKEGYTVFIAVSDDATRKLGRKRRADLEQLGLTKSLKKKYRYSYLAVIDDGLVTSEKLSKGRVETEGTLDNGLRYYLCSGGKTSGVTASLLIDGTERLKAGRGINIVIYNKELDEVISSVYFDTCADPNPKKQ